MRLADRIQGNPRLKYRMEGLGRGLYKFSRNPLSIVGACGVCAIVVLAVFAPVVVPYPAHVGAYVNHAEASLPPSTAHWFGTDVVGRDILSRVVFGTRFSLVLGVVVLALSAPFGVLIGLVCGYYKGRWSSTLLLRVTDVFLAVPPLVLALAVSAVLEPNIFNAMMAVSVSWWPWYARLVYATASSVKNESYVLSAELVGASRFRILFKEILPNCISPILTKATIDMGMVIIVGASLSFVGLGTRPPRPDLGTMVAEGARYIPYQWWMSLFPAIAIVVIVLAFNLLGDGLRDMLAVEGV